MAKAVMSIAPLLYLVRERDNIRLMRLSDDPPPWTTDPIFQEYKFCNVRRRDDRVSKWLLKYVLKQEHIDLDLKSFLLFSALCRWINWPPTIDAILQAGLYPAKEVDWDKIVELLLNRQDKTWTGAYMILAPQASLGLSKPEFIVKKVVVESMGATLGTIVEKLPELSRLTIWEVLQGQLYWGSFMAGQVVDDWTWTSVLKSATDLYTWVPMGPGSLRGYKRLMAPEGTDWQLVKKPNMLEWCQQLVVWRGLVIERLGPNFSDLTLMDVQNCLCEVDKYLRVKNGEGRPRSKYRPETAY